MDFVDDCAQHLVAGGMPMRVVDRLEAIEVEKQDRHLRSVSQGVGNLRFDALVEESAVEGCWGRSSAYEFI